jgi:hypothetical protein
MKSEISLGGTEYMQAFTSSGTLTEAQAAEKSILTRVFSVIENKKEH